MTERESAHPGNYDIPAELVSSSADEKSKRFNETSIPKRLQNPNTFQVDKKSGTRTCFNVFESMLAYRMVDFSEKQ